MVSEVEQAAREHGAVLLANHGPVVSGRDPDEAADAAEELEATARLHLSRRGQRTRLRTAEQVVDLGECWPRA